MAQPITEPEVVPVSVVIVSRGRPDMLRRCLTAVSQIRYPAFEVIVAADPTGLAQLHAFDPGNTIKAVAFDAPNISEARNRACDHAAGEVIAFIDDDSVPEPTWLTHLIAPFARKDVAVAGGFVRGRNGISWQWKARKLDGFGRAHDIEVDAEKTTVFSAPAQGALKTEGTNMAVRRAFLARIGGFDPAYHFFLDETDVNMRAARAGVSTAIVPLAQMHHGFAASPMRRGDRAPTDLFDIGASWAVFLRKHVSENHHTARWAEIVHEQRLRAVRWMQSGGLDALDVVRLLRSLQTGFAAGLSRTLGTGAITDQPLTPFLPFSGDSGSACILSGRVWERGKIMKKARVAVADGHIVTVILLSPTALFHHLEFHSDGFWLQRGGLFGKSDRSQALLKFHSFSGRVEAETRRVGRVRRVLNANSIKNVLKKSV